MRNPKKSNKQSSKDKTKIEPQTRQVYENEPSFLENFKGNSYKVILCVLVFFVLVYFQVLYSKSSRYDTNKDSDVDYWEILGVENNSNLPTINKKYRELAKIWHPDKNPGCALCHEKFRQITKAHEVLVSEVQKGEGGGKKSVFRSNPVYLTTKNYHKLVEESNDFWLILVYEQTKHTQHMEYVAEVWDEVSTKNSGIIKFGVIDVRDQADLLHYIPFKFQYFPNIYTYLHNEDCELFHNIDSMTPITLQEFIEDTFVSKVPQIDDYKLSSIVQTANSETKLDVTNKRLSFSDLDLEVVILSTKNYVDLVTKDFARTYCDTMKIFQNEMGYFDKSLKILKSKGDHRVFVVYNKLFSADNSFFMEKRLINLPIKFNTGKDNKMALQNTFNILKHFSLLRIYSNNYLRHCVHKQAEEEGSTEKQTFIDFCVIFIETKNNRNQDENIYKSFLSLIVNKFETRLQNYGTTKKTDDSAVLNLNFGVASMDENVEIKSLYKKYLETNENNNVNLNFDESQNLFFIINNTNEKFVFKNFKNSEALVDYIGGLDNNDFFEDISFSFEYFPNYEVKSIHNLFVEEKHFSFFKVLTSVLYSQLQGKYVFTYMVLFLANIFLLKFDPVKFFSATVATSIIVGFLAAVIFF